MAKVEMTAASTFIVGGGKVKAGESFNAANEEDARLYEEKGLAKKVKQYEPSRTQDVQTEEPKELDDERPAKARKTKSK